MNTDGDNENVLHKSEVAPSAGPERLLVIALWEPEDSSVFVSVTRREPCGHGLLVSKVERMIMLDAEGARLLSKALASAADAAFAREAESLLSAPAPAAPAQ